MVYAERSASDGAMAIFLQRGGLCGRLIPGRGAECGTGAEKKYHQPGRPRRASHWACTHRRSARPARYVASRICKYSTKYYEQTAYPELTEIYPKSTMARYRSPAATAMNGYKLWTTDGIAAHSVLLKNLSIRANCSEPAAFTALDDSRVLFHAAVRRAGQRSALRRIGRRRVGGGLDEAIIIGGPDENHRTFAAQSGCDLIRGFDGAVGGRIAITGHQQYRLSDVQSGDMLLLKGSSAELASVRATEFSVSILA